MENMHLYDEFYFDIDDLDAVLHVYEYSATVSIKKDNGQWFTKSFDDADAADRWLRRRGFIQ